jgi:ribosomal protein L37AE/L43A
VSAKAGEIARETAGYRCQDCGQEMLVHVGQPIQPCSNCGKESFDTGWLRKPKDGSPVLVRAESQNTPSE